MAAGRERLQQKHPKVRHEILRDAVVRVIKKDFQFAGPERQPDAGGYSLDRYFPLGSVCHVLQKKQKERNQ
jgi:hypothetical protein